MRRTWVSRICVLQWGGHQRESQATNNSNISIMMSRPMHGVTLLPWLQAHDVNLKTEDISFFGNHSISKTTEPNDSFATWSHLSWHLWSFRLCFGITIVSRHCKMGTLESRVLISTLLISGVFVASCTVFVILFRVEETWIGLFSNPNLSLTLKSNLASSDSSGSRNSTSVRCLSLLTSYAHPFFLLSNSTLLSNPWIARSLTKAFFQAMEYAYEAIHQHAALRYILPWLDSHVEETWSIMSPDREGDGRWWKDHRTGKHWTSFWNTRITKGWQRKSGRLRRFFQGGRWGYGQNSVRKFTISASLLKIGYFFGTLGNFWVFFGTFGYFS